MKRRLTLAPLYLRMPEAQSATRREAVKRLSASADSTGCVPWSAVPGALVAPLLARESGLGRMPDTVPVPVAAFLLELGHDDDRPPVAGPSSVSKCIHTSFLILHEPARFLRA